MASIHFLPDNVEIFDLPEDHVALVDADDFLWLSCFHWKCYRKQKSFYARTFIKSKRGGKWVYMHRLVKQTPGGSVCHHKNRNSLDNRKSNLENMSKTNHARLHLNDTLTVRYDPNFPYCPD